MNIVSSERFLIIQQSWKFSHEVFLIFLWISFMMFMWFTNVYVSKTLWGLKIKKASWCSYLALQTFKEKVHLLFPHRLIVNLTSRRFPLNKKWAVDMMYLLVQLQKMTRTIKTVVNVLSNKIINNMRFFQQTWLYEFTCARLRLSTV